MKKIVEKPSFVPGGIGEFPDSSQEEIKDYTVWLEQAYDKDVYANSDDLLEYYLFLKAKLGE